MNSILKQLLDPKSFQSYIDENMKTSTYKALWKNEIKQIDYCAAKVYNANLAEYTAAMVGSDTTVMVDGSRSEDVYFQKYKMYLQLAKSLESCLTYVDFAVDGTDGSGKGGVGVIRLSRA